MPAPINIFKEKLLAKEQQIGCWASMASPYAAEMLGTAGFDWILIDGEHAPNDIPIIATQLQALEASSSAAVVRLPIGEPAIIKRALDIGANTLLIPMVETGEQARELVRATRYPPFGIRGVGANAARAARFGTIPDYVQSADEQICLLIQVETRKAVENLDDILAVDGIDGIFIGPADLAASMGYLGQPHHPEVKALILDTIARIRAANIAAGILSLDEAFCFECLEIGVEFLAVGLDASTYVKALGALAAKFKSTSEP